MRSGLTAPRWLLPSSALADVFSSLLAADIAGEVAQTDRRSSACPTETCRTGGCGALSTWRWRPNWRAAFRSTPRSAGPEVPAYRGPGGPPGSGKTTTLVKLAVTYGLAARKSVQLLSLDNLRVGAADQLRSYAAILGVASRRWKPGRAGSGPRRTSRASRSILIDTPGYCLADMDMRGGTGAVLSARATKSMCNWSYRHP